MADCCICFTTDAGYLFPTVLAAYQARAQARAELADVMLFGFDIPARMQADFAPVCAAAGMAFVALGRDAIDGQPMVMSRLFLERLLPKQYSQILYMDGDVQIVAPLDALLRADVPAGRFMAAADPMAFMVGANGGETPDVAIHLQALGLSCADYKGYFNSGVMRINRDGWAALESEALALANRAGKSFLFLDQDALNLAGRGRAMPMSLRWNFPIFLRNGGVEDVIQPTIYHFMSSPKPWQGNFPPWAWRHFQAYLDFARRYPGIAAYRKGMSPPRWARYLLQQQVKQAMETASWRMSARRERILAYEDGLAAQ